MNVPRAGLVIVVDRWGAGFLGAYGNTWLETPAVNRLAAESLLFEQALTDTPDLATCYRGYWAARPAGCPVRSSDPGLAAELGHAGIPAELITDDPSIADHPLAAGFDSKWLVAAGPPQAATDPAETQFGQLLATAIERLQDPTPRLVWLHARGPAGPWDAPPEYRDRFRDDEDPPARVDVLPPDFRTTPHTDPDELLGWVQAYAGQIAVQDLCLDALLEAFRGTDWAAAALTIFTAPRGFPLGEHGRVGPCDHALYSELLHVPLLIRHGQGLGALARDQRLVRPADVGATLRAWFHLPPPSGPPVGLSLLPVLADEAAAPSLAPVPHAAADVLTAERPVLVVGPGQQAVRTAAWLWRGTGETHELFVKPDDQWEVNDVARRCPDDADRLRQLASELLAKSEE